MTSPAELARPDLDQARSAYDALVAQGMKLDLTRGKPSAAQLDLANELLHLPGPGEYKAADGTDARNYGGLQGLPELREIFAPVLQVPVEQLIAGGNASLELMHDTLVYALLKAMPGPPRRWVEEERVVFLVPVARLRPALRVCERFGIEMIPVPLTDDGPDMDEVERLVAADPAVKGIWCVPKYSNPTGIVYSDETVRAAGRHADGRAGLPDLVGQRVRGAHAGRGAAPIADVLALAAEAGNADRVFVFGSTSKITFAGAGVAFFGASPANLAWWLAVTGKRTIGPDKINHLRHVMFLRDAAGVARAHGASTARSSRRSSPRWSASSRRTSPTPRVSRGPRRKAATSSPCACPTAARRRSCGWPRRRASRSPRRAPRTRTATTRSDAIIRLAPTFPVLDEVEKAMTGVAVCVKLALAQR